MDSIRAVRICQATRNVLVRGGAGCDADRDLEQILGEFRGRCLPVVLTYRGSAEEEAVSSYPMNGVSALRKNFLADWKTGGCRAGYLAVCLGIVRRYGAGLNSVTELRGARFFRNDLIDLRCLLRGGRRCR